MNESLKRQSVEALNCNDVKCCNRTASRFNGSIQRSNRFSTNCHGRDARHQRAGTRAMDVCDPANTVQSVINTAQEIAKFVEMINNQVQQIETLTEQLNKFKRYKEVFGDPNAVVLTTVQPLVNDPSQDRTRRNAHRARRRSGCGRGHSLQRQRPVHPHWPLGAGTSRGVNCRKWLRPSLTYARPWRMPSHQSW